jgi:hypothetical protein
LINKRLQAAPFCSGRAGCRQSCDGGLDAVLRLEHFRRSDVEDVIGHRKAVRGIRQLIGDER